MAQEAQYIVFFGSLAMSSMVFVGKSPEGAPLEDGSPPLACLSLRSAVRSLPF